MNISDFHFAEPRWLWLAAVAPVLLLGLQRYSLKAGRERLARMASPQFVGQLTTSHSRMRRELKNLMLLLAIGLAGLALARPQWGNTETGNAFIGEDVVFVLDCSQSMTATDVAPSRMQRAKFAMLDFVRKQSHGRVGLVAFAGSAFIQCPLTFDAGAFEETLLSIDEKTIPVPGTDIGRALNEAYRALDKGGHRKTVVLVTDGEDLEKSGVTAARQLATNGVVVFTVGVGTPAGKEISMLNAAGQMELLHDAKGEIVRSQLDETTLREIAQATGGSYYPLGSLGDGLGKVRFAMHTLDTGGGLHPSVKNGVDRFHGFIAAMLGLLIVESLLGTRRRMVSAPVALALFVLLSGSPAPAAETTNSIPPVTARDFYNAGTGLLAAKKYPEAERMFLSSLAQQDERVQLVTLFNLGHTRYADGWEILKKGPDAQQLSARGRAVLASGDAALRAGESALAQDDLSKMVSAYLAGRGARRELRAAEKVVSAAMEIFGKTLNKWRRAADDFRGAAELNPADTNALHNAEVVERDIAALVDTVRKMQEMMGQLAGQKQQLGKMMGKLKGRMPGQDAPPGGKGDGDEDEDGEGKGDVKPESLMGRKEDASREGEQVSGQLSPDVAGQILDGISVDSSRRLSMSDKQGVPAKDKNGRNW